jgi:hypothetical protein
MCVIHSRSQGNKPAGQFGPGWLRTLVRILISRPHKKAIQTAPGIVVRDCLLPGPFPPSLPPPSLDLPGIAFIADMAATRLSRYLRSRSLFSRTCSRGRQRGIHEAYEDLVL